MYQNDVLIAGATSSTLVIPSLTVANAGIYYVQTATAMDGTYASLPFPVQVVGSTPVAGDSIWIVPSSIIFEPNDPVDPGGRLFVVQGASAFPSGASIQWYKDGIPIPGSTNTVFSLPNPQNGDAATYTASVNGVYSSGGQLILNTVKPRFLFQPTSQIVNLGQPASLNVSYDPTVPVNGSLQWVKDGVAIPGATQTTYSLSSVTAADLGTYVCIATNNAGNTSTNPVTISLSPSTSNTVITQQPVLILANVGDSGSFSFSATNLNGTTIQWYKDGLLISGTNSTTL